MTDQIIGRIFVKVTPDTSAFRAEAKAQLEREERRLPELTTRLAVELDDGEAAETAAEARAVRDSAQQAMRDLTLRVNLDDLSSVRSALARVNAELVNLDAIELPVELDRDSLESMRDLLEQRVKDIGIDIKVNLDDEASIERAIKKVEAQLSALNEINLNVDLNDASLSAAKAELEARLDQVRVETDIDNAASARVSAALAILTRTRDAVIRPVIDRSALAAVRFVDVLSGFRALRESIAQARTAFLGLFTNLPQISTMALAVTALSGALVSAAGNAIGLAGSLAQLLPIALALPGIAIGLAAMAVAFADFGNQLPAVAERFGQLQGIISDGFWEIARGPINNLLTAALPLLEAGLGKVSGSIGGFFAAFAGSLGAEGGFLSELPQMFDRLNESINIFTGYTPALAAIMTIFGQIGSSILPPLADLIGRTADEFAAFLTAQTAGDGLTSIVESSIEALSGLIETLKGAFQVFTALWRAADAAGTATLSSLGSGLQEFAKTLEGPEIQGALTSLFSAVQEMFDSFVNEAGPAFSQVFIGLVSVLRDVLPLVGSAWGQMAAVLGEIFSTPAFQEGLTSFFVGVNAAVTALLPALTPIADLVGSLGPVLGQLAAQIGEVFGSLTPTLDGLVAALLPVIEMLGDGLVQVVRAISPALSEIATVASATLSGLTPLLQPIIDALVQIVQAVLPALMPVISALQPLLLSIAELALPVISTLLAALAPILADAVAALQPVIDIIVELLDLLVPLLIPALDMMTRALAQNLGVVVEGAAQAIAGLVDVIRGVIDFLVGVFTGDWERAWSGVQSIFSGIIDAVIGILKIIFGPFGTMAGIFSDGLSRVSDLWSSVWSSVGAVAVAAWNGIVNHIQDRINFMVGIFRGIWGAVSGAITSLWNEIRRQFERGIQTAVDAVDTGVDDTLSFFRNLPDQIRSALGNLGKLLVDAGKALLRGLIDGIQSMFGEVRGNLNSLTDLMPDWKGPPSTDRTLLYGAGRLIIDGFIEGLESRYDMVRRSLGELTKDVASTEFGVPTASLGINSDAYGSDVGRATDSKTINYHAAPGSSMDSEEDLFAALGRARAWGW
ncbi:phage tail protein [Salinispora tropica]|uniref:Phage-related protein-like protein n=1 Tax=Salinispora tropica (strain ATCC BAA-916 / DSM 44818 / JCM 13857 / NBRC 105044 / CNB-440) TaxID=369723 RepID=A4X2B7_SALTO|nr:phage protein [Salinispora tropica]ABP53017.1 Phage-related protein-like protein [Salinispora tropica CNB-440]